MTSVTLPPEIARRLDAAARRLGRPAETLVAEAVADYLQDMEDGAIAAERYKNPEGPATLDELDRELGVGRRV
jgi:predicted DNA-binding protein